MPPSHAPAGNRRPHHRPAERTVLGAADLAAIMVHGRIAKVGRPDDLEAELSTAYLGA